MKTTTTRRRLPAPAADGVVAVRHLGPTAQDFHAAFGLGHSDRHISTVDADGVALSAIQGLHELLQEKSQQIAELEARNADLTRRLEIIERQLIP